MDTLLTSHGVLKKATRLFITSDDVMQIFGCKHSKAYDIVRKVNNYAKEKGYEPMQIPGKTRGRVPDHHL